ncbi:TonB-dependent receptor [Novosphingobium sp. 11B]
MALAIAAPATTFAQTADQASQANAPSDVGGDIVVTARKREENILETPISIAAFSATALQQRGIDTIMKMSESTPGLNVNQNGSGRNDRSYQQFIIRGFTPSSTKTTTSSMFVDGAPISSTSALSSISDPERIEILKGPQATYFGRSTFAGAVNVVNKVPGNDWGGSIRAMLGTRNNYSFHADIEGPIVRDLLAFRISGDGFGKDGSWRNTYSGETLGDQSSRNLSAMLVFTPASNLTVKAFGIYSRDDDNHPANGLLGTHQIADTSGNVVVANQSNCNLTGSTSGIAGQGTATSYPFFCGTTPRLASGPSANTDFDDVAKNWLSTVKGRIFDYDKGVEGYGLLRNFYHTHLGVDWELGDTGVTLSSLTAYNREEFSVFIDLDNQGSTSLATSSPSAERPYFDYPYLIERLNQDISQELRATYDNGGPIQATFGGSYLNATTRSGVGGGFLPSATYAETGKTRSRTFGVFGAVTYEFTPQLSVSAEGRYQVDTLYAYSQPTGTTIAAPEIATPGYYAGGDLLLKQSYKNFLPRVIVKYETDGGLMSYASWSKGVNPGAFNTEFLTLSQDVIQQAIAEGVKIAVEPEKVTNYEVGLKGALFDRRVNFSLAVYYAQWRNQINAISLMTVGSNGLPAVLSGSANTGSIDMKGVELETNWRLNDLITINAAGAINDSKILKYTNPPVSRLTGVFDFHGNELPQTSKYSANVGVQFGGELNSGDASWFARADYNFKSGMWSSAANVVKTQDSHKVNLRAGTNIGPFSYEMFVTNAFNNKAYTSVGEQGLFANGFPYSSTLSALVVGLPDLRTYGVKVGYKF